MIFVSVFFKCHENILELQSVLRLTQKQLRMESDDVWGEELPDETIDEIFRASQSCTQLSNKKSRNAGITLANSKCFTEFRIPNIQAKHTSVVLKNPVSFQPPKKSAFVPKKITKVLPGQSVNNVVEDSKAFDNASQLSREFHVLSDSLKLSQVIHQQKYPLFQPSCSKHENSFKKFHTNSKFCSSFGSSNLSQEIDNNSKHSELAKINKLNTVIAKSNLNEAKCNQVKLSNTTSNNSKTVVSASSLHAELINLQQKSDKVKRNKHDTTVDQITDGHCETPSVSVAKQSFEKKNTLILPSKFNGLEFAEWKLLDSKPKINIDLSKHMLQNKSRKLFTIPLSLMKTTFSRGTLFGDLLGPGMFEKSLPESPLIELRNVQNFSEWKKKKQVHFEKLLADYDRLNNVCMYQNCRSMEHCYPSLHRLILQESLDSITAKPHIEKIVCEVAALLGDQLALLQELKLSTSELQDLDRELAELPNRGQALGIPLTSPQFSYGKEVGVEARRGLGTLAALSALSQHAISLVVGTAELSPSVQATLLQKPNSSPYMYKERQRDATEMHITYRNMKFGFLKLMRDLCTAIRQERRTLAYTGVLTGIISLLIAARINCSLFPGESNELLCEIVKEVVFCRPRIEVVIHLVDLLCVTNPDLQIGRSLCRNSPKDKYIEKCGVVYFHSEDSCVLQVLCCLLEFQHARIGVLAALCHHMVHWLSGSFLAPGQEPHWLQPATDDLRPACACRRRVAELTCNLLHRAFVAFVELNRSCAGDMFSYVTQNRQVDMSIMQKLRRTLQAGIVLIHRLEDHNPDFMMNVASSEGEWQSFVLGCCRQRSGLGLTTEQLRCLEELVASVEVDVATDSYQIGHADLNVIFEHLWKDNVRYVRRNYVPPRNSSSEFTTLQIATWCEKDT